MLSIKNITASEILDSRGNPTIETKVILQDGRMAQAAIPSGASTGKYEAFELRDQDPERYNGMGVLKAVNNVNQIIAPKLAGLDIVQQGKIDALMLELDHTPNKSNLGANAILSVSIAVCKAAALATNVNLFQYISELMQNKLPVTPAHMPTPIFNIINGGKHGNGNLDIQEFHVIPATTKLYHEALQIGDEIYFKLKNILSQKNSSHSIGDEGGFTPNLNSNSDALELIMEAIKDTKYRFGFDIFLGLDIAATNLKKEDSYSVKERPVPMLTDEFIEYLRELHTNYGLLLLEDPLAEDDWAGWQKITESLGKEILIVGDDLLVTNPERLNKAINEKACSAILIKPNQIGTLSETFNVIKTAQNAKFKIVVSHRSGETNDTFIADLAAGVNADYIKFGAPARGERIAKYNRLLEIEKELKLI